MEKETLAEVAVDAIDLLANLRDALSGQGTLTAQSQQPGTWKKYTTLLREMQIRLTQAVSCERTNA